MVAAVPNEARTLYCCSLDYTSIADPCATKLSQQNAHAARLHGRACWVTTDIHQAACCYNHRLRYLVHGIPCQRHRERSIPYSSRRPRVLVLPYEELELGALVHSRDFATATVHWVLSFTIPSLPIWWHEGRVLCPLHMSVTRIPWPALDLPAALLWPAGLKGVPASRLHHMKRIYMELLLPSS